MKFNRRQIRYGLVVLSLIVIIFGTITIASSKGTSAKYMQVRSMESAAVTVNADLAKKLEVKEHKLIGNYYDEYDLDMNTEVSGNSYALMPGVKIPKDTFVRVEEKTSIPAYLFVEIVDETGLETEGENAVFRYTVASGWTKQDDITSKHAGGVVYLYDDILQTEGTAVEDYVIQVFNKNDKINITSLLNKDSRYTGTLTVYAYLAQAVDGNSPKATFETQFPRV